MTTSTKKLSETFDALCGKIEEWRDPYYGVSDETFAKFYATEIEPIKGQFLMVLEAASSLDTVLKAKAIYLALLQFRQIPETRDWTDVAFDVAAFIVTGKKFDWDQPTLQKLLDSELKALEAKKE